jgi:uridylate kinase
MVPITALHEERDKRQLAQQELEGLRARMAANVQPTPPPQQQQISDVAKELDRLWETEPRKAVQAEIYTAMTWRDNLDTIVDLQVSDLSAKYPEASAYTNEVRQYIRSLPLNQRGNPGVAEFAYYVVRGQKVDSIINKTRETTEQELMRRMQEGTLASSGSLPGTVSGGGSTPGAVTITDEERRVADAMGMTEADYVKHRIQR